MILVTGATGHYGKATIDFLLSKTNSAKDIAALVRDEAKAADLKAKGITLKTGDYDNYPALVAAFKGVDKLLLVSGSDIASRDKQHKNVINAAVEAGVKHILYTSFERKNETETSPIYFLAKSHLETERLIKESGLTYTFFKNNLYLDVLPMFFGEKVQETGIFLPAGDTRSAFASRSDMAEATANVLLTEGHENKAYSFGNTENVSLPQIAEYLGEVFGTPVNYVSPPQDVYVETLKGAGVPAEFIVMMSGFAEAIKQGELTSEKSDLENILGRKPVTAKEFFKAVYAQQ